MRIFLAMIVVSGDKETVVKCGPVEFNPIPIGEDLGGGITTLHVRAAREWLELQGRELSLKVKEIGEKETR